MEVTSEGVPTMWKTVLAVLSLATAAAAARADEPHARIAAHGDRIYAIALSPDGTLLASGSRDGSVRLWSFPSGAPRSTLLEGRSAVGALAFSPDSRVLAASDEAGAIHLWSLPEGSPLGRLTGHTQWVTGLAFSPDGRTLASCSGDRTVRLWTVATRTVRATLRGHTSTVFAVAFTPDGRTVLSGSADRTIRLWTVSTGAAAGSLSGPTREVFTLAVTPDGRTVLSGSSDGLRFWSLADRRLLGTTEAHVESLALPAGGTFVAAGLFDAEARLYSVPDGRELARLWTPGRSVKVVLSRDGRWLAAAAALPLPRGPLGEIVVHAVPEPEGPSRAAAAFDAVEPHGAAVTALALASDGARLASGDARGGLKLWSAREDRAQADVPTTSAEPVAAVAFAPDGRILASAQGDSIRLWAIPDARPLATLDGHVAAVRALAFAPDGRTLASVSDDRSVKLWSLPEGRLRTTIREHGEPLRAVAWTADGTGVFSAGGTLRLWSASDGRARASLAGHAAAAVRSLVVARDGRSLVSAADDGTVIAWEVPTGTLRARLADAGPAVAGACAAADGRTLVAASEDGALRTWSLPARSPRAPLAWTGARTTALACGGPVVVSGHADGTLARWDLATGRSTVITRPH
jgi:WD40 repeat protein